MFFFTVDSTGLVMVPRILQKVLLQWFAVDQTLQNGTLETSISQIVHPNGSRDLVTNSLICTQLIETVSKIRRPKQRQTNLLCKNARYVPKTC